MQERYEQGRLVKKYVASPLVLAVVTTSPSAAWSVGVAPVTCYALAIPSHHFREWTAGDGAPTGGSPSSLLGPEKPYEFGHRPGKCLRGKIGDPYNYRTVNCIIRY